jgi:hypothetical protein
MGKKKSRKGGQDAREMGLPPSGSDVATAAELLHKQMLTGMHDESEPSRGGPWSILKRLS